MRTAQEIHKLFNRSIYFDFIKVGKIAKHTRDDTLKIAAFSLKRSTINNLIKTVFDILTKLTVKIKIHIYILEKIIMTT